MLRTVGPPSRLGLRPRCRLPQRLFEPWSGGNPALAGPFFPVLPGAGQKIVCPPLLFFADKEPIFSFLHSPPRSGAPMRLRCEGATTREPQASDFGAHLRRRGCAPRHRRRASRDEEAWGHGETRSGAPTRIPIYCLINPIYTLNNQKKHYIIDIRL